MGKSPQHSRTVALLLNPTTGLVSPQLRVKYNSSFNKVTELPTESQWKTKSGFISKEIDKKIETGTGNDTGDTPKVRSNINYKSGTNT